MFCKCVGCQQDFYCKPHEKRDHCSKCWRSKANCRNVYCKKKARDLSAFCSEFCEQRLVAKNRELEECENMMHYVNMAPYKGCDHDISDPRTYFGGEEKLVSHKHFFCGTVFGSMCVYCDDTVQKCQICDETMQLVFQRNHNRHSIDNCKFFYCCPNIADHPETVGECATGTCSDCKRLAKYNL